MLKVTVLYGHPENAHAFEKYYAETHLPLSTLMKGVSRVELTRFAPAPDGSKPDFYRMAEIYFASEAQMQSTLASPEGKATAADLAQFATGGVKLLVGSVES